MAFPDTQTIVLVTGVMHALVAPFMWLMQRAKPRSGYFRLLGIGSALSAFGLLLYALRSGQGLQWWNYALSNLLILAYPMALVPATLAFLDIPVSQQLRRLGWLLPVLLLAVLSVVMPYPLWRLMVPTLTFAGLCALTAWLLWRYVPRFDSATGVTFITCVVSAALLIGRAGMALLLPDLASASIGGLHMLVIMLPLLSAFVLAMAFPIAEFIRDERRLIELAEIDALTQLPNRRQALRQIKLALQSAEVSQRRVAVVFFDLDGFKHINDSLGHPIGDQLLALIAERLRSRLDGRSSLARLGGDEFLLLLEFFDQPAEAEQAVDAMLQVLRTPFEIAGRSLFVSASAGLALFPDDGGSGRELIRNADLAMYEAKASGRNRWVRYRAQMGQQAVAQLELESSLRGALRSNGFVLHYQPKLDLVSGRVTGAEALLRMRGSEGELVAPDRFIPFAERSGLIVPIGDWVLQQACIQLRTWRAAGLGDLVVAVNVSAAQLRDAQFVGRVAQVLKQSWLPSSSLELELTESVLMDDPELAAARLAELKRIGVRLALDDFGTGYSSLAYLLRFPIDVLKIDRSFVSRMIADINADTLVASIIDLARRMRLRVVAEGVETDAQLQRLRLRGCDQVQGYLLGMPVEASMEVPWMRDQNALRAALNG